MILKIINKFGVDIKRFPSRDLRRRKLLLDEFSITDVIDVGANMGQFGKELRAIGFTGNIHSYEPLSQAFAVLSKNAKPDPKWDIMNVALGAFEEQKEINISQNLFSSSFLDKKAALEEQEPTTKYISKEIVTIKTLDSIFPDYYSKEKNYYLKIDTQGFEKNVLEGASGSLDKIKGIQLEMSVNPMYENSTPFIEMYNYIVSKGFELYSLENGFHDPKTGRLNEVEGIFYKSK